MHAQVLEWTKAQGRPVAWAEVWSEDRFLGWIVRRSVHHTALKRKATVYEAYKGRTNKHPRNLSGRTVKGLAQFIHKRQAIQALMASYGVSEYTVS